MEKYILFLLIVAYIFYRNYIDRVVDMEIEKEIRELRTDLKNIQFLVNNREIHVSHSIYYLQKLNLAGKTGITEHHIREKSFLLMDETTASENNILVADVEDIKAARSFLLDQWNYFTWMN